MKQPKCITPYCKNRAGKGRRVCYTCMTQKHRKKDPMRYSYDALKANAIRRGHVFTITYKDFQDFCRETLYHLGKGRSKVSFTIDKIENDLGYVKGNLRVLPKHENSRKGTKTLIYDWETGYAIYR